MSTSIRIDSLSKRYKLGLTHAGSIRNLANGLVRRILRREVSTTTTDHQVEDSSRVENGYFWALKDISFELEPGDVVGVIGRNGAGKSTLLKILSRVTSPTFGRIELSGRVASLLEVGTGFHPELTGRENVYLNGTILGMTRAEVSSRFDAIVDFAGIEKFIDTPVKRYSSGMTVRLGFAVAAHLQPEILIVDEVLAVGDVEFQRKCLGKMDEVANSGRTVMFVSHNMSSVSQLCRQGIVLDAGMTEGIKPIHEAIELYMRQGATDGREGVFEVELDPAEPQIASITVSSEQQPSAIVRHDREFQIAFKVGNPRKQSGLRLSIAICDRMQRKVFTAVTDVSQSGDYDTYELSVAARFLLPGSYTIIAGILDPNLQILDHHRFVCPFTIENVGDELFAMGSGDYGVVFGQYEWKTESLEQGANS